MANFTPGPWTAYDRGIGWEVRVPDLRFGTRTVNDGFRDTFTQADALLVAAAPDLFAALIFVRDHICDPERGPRDLYPAFGLNASEAIRLVQSAISKAEGRS